jgi:DNA topoisomerase-2
MEKKIRTERNESDYTKHTHHSHVLARPEVYIGSMQKIIRPEWLLDTETKKLVNKNVDIPEGLIRIYLEIVSNAADNSYESRWMKKSDPGDIKVTMENGWITVRNTGEPMIITVEQELSSPNECITLIDHLFGTLLTSSHYDENIYRIAAGTNGYGAKLSNIFSKEFIVRVGNSKEGLEHESIWKNNMYEKVSSKTTPAFEYDKKTKMWVKGKGKKYTGESYVEVSYLLDFEKFGYTEYPTNTSGLFAKYLIDYSLTCKIPVYFNNELFDNRNIKEYSKLIFSEEKYQSSIVHYEWEGDKIPISLKKLKDKELADAISKSSNPDCIPMIEICVIDTPDECESFSWVNGIITKDGGINVDEANNTLAKDFLEMFIESQNISTPEPGKKKKENKTLLTIKDVKPHFSIIINCRLKDPTFTSQSKTKLLSPKCKFNFKSQELKSCLGWDLFIRLKEEEDFKHQRFENKTNPKTKGRLKLDKGEEANKAGSEESYKCTLYLTEGQSAEGYPKKRISLLPGNKDYAGYYPLKGKVLNTINASDETISNNEEIKTLIRLIGLTENMDYSIEENRKTLRYGAGVLSCVDADNDGKHINCLLLNFLNENYRSFLQNGLFAYLLTPVIKLFDKKKIYKRFYSEDEFIKWLNKNPNHKYKVKYYKGLGTSETPDIIDDMTTAATIICFYDSSADEYLKLAFDKTKADLRKQWIENWRDKTRVDDIQIVDLSKILKKRNITNIINTDLIDYSVHVLFRSIPNFKDGLKKSQRQALYYILKTWKYGIGDVDETKVAQIVGTASTVMQYHHGPKSLEDTIIKMAQNYIGSNNLNLFQPCGDFGSRHQLGKDCASSRYILTKTEWFIKHIFQKELIDIIDFNFVDGEKVEPVWIPCDIPLHIINGCNGIGTGYSTFIPCHNPFDIIKWIIQKCEGTTPKFKILPWYNKFNGEIKLKNLKSKIENISEEFGEEENNLITGITMKTYGKFEIIKTYPDESCDILITEIPIGVSPFLFGKWLEKNEGLKPKKDDKMDFVFKTFFDNSIQIPEEKIVFKLGKVKSVGGGPITHETLKLVKSFGISNMVLIDDKGFPIKYNSVGEMLEVYYTNMIEVYGKMIQKRIENTKIEIDNINIHIKFLNHILDKEITYENTKKNDIYTQMNKHGIPNEFLEKVKIYDLTYEELELLKNKKEKLEKEFSDVKKQKPEKLWVDRLKIFQKELEKRKYGEVDE